MHPSLENMKRRDGAYPVDAEAITIVAGLITKELERSHPDIWAAFVAEWRRDLVSLHSRRDGSLQKYLVDVCNVNLEVLEHGTDSSKVEWYHMPAGKMRSVRVHLTVPNSLLTFSS